MITNSDAKARGYFPLEYFLDFLRFVDSNRDLIEVITYDDFEWGNDFSEARSYPDEKQNWLGSLKSGEKDPSKIYLLLQHDVDSYPERTHEVLEWESRYKTPSNVMIFNRRVNRKHLRSTGELEVTGYPLDTDLLIRLESHEKFVIAYHSNAYEQGKFSVQKSLQAFENDIQVLRKRFKINYYSTHGGTRDSRGYSNSILGIPESLNGDIRCVHNRFSPYFTGSFSDGGPNSVKDPNKVNLRNFVQSWRRGGRYRVLTHPQYYCSPNGISENLSKANWYTDMLQHFNSDKETYFSRELLNLSAGKSLNSLYREHQLYKELQFIKHFIRKVIRGE